MTTMLPELNLTEVDLATWARARIVADVETLVSLGVRHGVFTRGMQVRPALDLGSGLVFIGERESRSVYALGPSTVIIGENENGERIEYDA